METFSSHGHRKAAKTNRWSEPDHSIEYHPALANEKKKTLQDLIYKKCRRFHEHSSLDSEEGKVQQLVQQPLDDVKEAKMTEVEPVSQEEIRQVFEYFQHQERERNEREEDASMSIVDQCLDVLHSGLPLIHAQQLNHKNSPSTISEEKHLIYTSKMEPDPILHQYFYISQHHAREHWQITLFPPKQSSHFDIDALILDKWLSDQLEKILTAADNLADNYEEEVEEGRPKTRNSFDDRLKKLFTIVNDSFVELVRQWSSVHPISTELLRRLWNLKQQFSDVQSLQTHCGQVKLNHQVSRELDVVKGQNQKFIQILQHEFQAQMDALKTSRDTLEDENQSLKQELKRMEELHRKQNQEILQLKTERYMNMEYHSTHHSSNASSISARDDPCEINTNMSAEEMMNDISRRGLSCLVHIDEMVKRKPLQSKPEISDVILPIFEHLKTKKKEGRARKKLANGKAVYVLFHQCQMILEGLQQVIDHLSEKPKLRQAVAL